MSIPNNNSLGSSPGDELTMRSPKRITVGLNLNPEYNQKLNNMIDRSELIDLSKTSDNVNLNETDKLKQLHENYEIKPGIITRIHHQHNKKSEFTTGFSGLVKLVHKENPDKKLNALIKYKHIHGPSPQNKNVKHPILNQDPKIKIDNEEKDSIIINKEMFAEDKDAQTILKDIIKTLNQPAKADKDGIVYRSKENQSGIDYESGEAQEIIKRLN